MCHEDVSWVQLRKISHTATFRSQLLIHAKMEFGLSLRFHFEPLWGNVRNRTSRLPSWAKMPTLKPKPKSLYHWIMVVNNMLLFLFQANSVAVWTSRKMWHTSLSKNKIKTKYLCSNCCSFFCPNRHAIGHPCSQIKCATSPWEQSFMDLHSRNGTSANMTYCKT